MAVTFIPMPIPESLQNSALGAKGRGMKFVELCLAGSWVRISQPILGVRGEPRVEARVVGLV